MADVIDCRRIRAARFVAKYWRGDPLTDEERELIPQFAKSALRVVLAALDGEEDPTNLGIPKRDGPKLRRALRG